MDRTVNLAEVKWNSKGFIDLLEFLGFGLVDQWTVSTTDSRGFESTVESWVLNTDKTVVLLEGKLVREGDPLKVKEDSLTAEVYDLPD